jgi:hypothetical protein
MKWLTIGIITLTILFPGIIEAMDTTASDREVFEELYSRCLRSIISESNTGASHSLSPVFPEGIPPSDQTRIFTEALICSMGYSISDSSREYSHTLTIMITDAKCTLIKNGKGFDRYISVTLHAQCTEETGIVLFVRKFELTSQDRISKSLYKRTDNGSQFSTDIKRTVLNNHPNRLRVTSLLTITAFLGYFAFSK